MYLVPLKVPAGWEVKWNHFYDIRAEDQRLEDGLIDYPFCEDMLYMTHQGRMRAIDLGWYPECDPEGAYHLILLQGHLEIPEFTHQVKQSVTRKIGGQSLVYRLEKQIIYDFEHPVKSFQSKDIYQVQAQIDVFLSCE
ncbi:hypothetical protein VA7868_01063 [Vibrio aerogenes CECT 7868]|uniref:Uncharacterized protein n=1 Tax=Vibrio aerogenes CECT 7868 TaxID=1216006 RepID=A0A1M5XAL5_9VIBR|nr:hypothetical protein [Vibrio aerogenes]SHH96769.1 hypothetical protein VA7868_01063 [Vibrio aerogenes CECT 7868]